MFFHLFPLRVFKGCNQRQNGWKYNLELDHVSSNSSSPTQLCYLGHIPIPLGFISHLYKLKSTTHAYLGIEMTSVKHLVSRTKSMLHHSWLSWLSSLMPFTVSKHCYFLRARWLDWSRVSEGLTKSRCGRTFTLVRLWPYCMHLCRY